VIAEYTFTLDNLGNHLSETNNEPYNTIPPFDSETINYAYNTANRITTAGTVAFTFDNNGNTTTKGSTAMGYDKSNNLTSVSGMFNATYSYDGTGMRREATRDGITTRYIMDILGMGNVLAETDAGGTIQNYYVHGLGLISRIKSNGTTSGYYVYDFRGSTVAITDATTAANLTHKYQYDEFGKVLQTEEADLNRFRYVGKYGVMYETDDLTFMRARYYDPSIGRFLSEDPIWSTNLYPYADNNPIVGIDPQGKSVEMIGLIADMLKVYGLALIHYDQGNKYMKKAEEYMSLGDKYQNKGHSSLAQNAYNQSGIFAREAATEYSNAKKEIIEGSIEIAVGLVASFVQDAAFDQLTDFLSAAGIKIQMSKPWFNKNSAQGKKAVIEAVTKKVRREMTQMQNLIELRKKGMDLIKLLNNAAK
jgi:RHS repeat-associated protein